MVHYKPAMIPFRVAHNKKIKVENTRQKKIKSVYISKSILSFSLTHVLEQNGLLAWGKTHISKGNE